MSGLRDLLESEENMPCRHCGPNKNSLTRKGPHIRVDCGKCGKFIKFAPQRVDADAIDWEKEAIQLPKHQGKSYAQVAKEDPEYIRWMAENIKGRPGKVADAAILEFGL